MFRIKFMLVNLPIFKCFIAHWFAHWLSISLSTTTGSQHFDALWFLFCILELRNFLWNFDFKFWVVRIYYNDKKGDSIKLQKNSFFSIILLNESALYLLLFLPYACHCRAKLYEQSKDDLYCFLHSGVKSHRRTLANRNHW